MKDIIEHKLTIDESLNGMRLDAAATTLLSDFSRSKIKRWIESGELKLNGETATPKTKVSTNDEILLSATLVDEGDWIGQDIPLDIVFEDEHILVINKPAGLVVHPAAGNPDGTLVNALIYRDEQMKKLPRAGIVHRLDKDTTGLMIVAKSLEAHQHLVSALEMRDIQREYQALVGGALTGGGTIDEPMARHPKNRLKMAVVHSGKHAVTHYRIAERFKHFTLLDVQLETGRTHQIRVHMAHTHKPIIGDQLYGRLRLPQGSTQTIKDALKTFNRQALHAMTLSLDHPISGEPLSFHAPLPDDFEQLLQVIRDEDH